MALKDKTKWNKKYETTQALLQHREPSIKLKELVSNIKTSIKSSDTKLNALDIACGTGKNSLYLAKHKYCVDALDISDVAIDFLNKKISDTTELNHIYTQVVDLEEYIPIKNKYDLVVMTNYLDRELIPHLIKSLKVDGILFIETYMHHKDNTKPSSNPDFLLQKDELKNFVTEDCILINYDEFDNDKEELYVMKKQSVIIQKKEK